MGFQKFQHHPPPHIKLKIHINTALHLWSETPGLQLRNMIFITKFWEHYLNDTSHYLTSFQDDQLGDEELEHFVNRFIQEGYRRTEQTCKNQSEKNDSFCEEKKHVFLQNLKIYCRYIESSFKALTRKFRIPALGEK